MSRVEWSAVVELSALLLLSAWGGPACAGEPPKKIERVAAANNEFAFDLYAKLASRNGNIFFSPLSLSIQQGITYAGERTSTESETGKILYFGANDDALHAALGQLVQDLNAAAGKKHYELQLASALWTQSDYPLLRKYTDLVTKSYGAGLYRADFARSAEPARRAINAWGEKQTSGKITLLAANDVSPLLRLIIFNTIYFNDNWAKPFSKDETKEGAFTLSDGKAAKVPLMRQTAEFRAAENEALRVLELPYANGDLAMIVLLPVQTDGLAALERNLTHANLAAWLADLRPRRVQVTLPRFFIAAQGSLKESLAALGMNAAFHSSSADLSGNAGRRDVYVANVIQKAFADVNEGDGSVAKYAPVRKSAPKPAPAGGEATQDNAGKAAPAAKPAAPIIFCADHPFVFLIRDTKTGCILFLGRVMSPAKPGPGIKSPAGIGCASF